jgi:hypothetical protein
MTTSEVFEAARFPRRAAAFSVDLVAVLALSWVLGPYFSPLIERVAIKNEIKSGVHGFWFTGPVLLLVFEPRFQRAGASRPAELGGRDA